MRVLAQKEDSGDRLQRGCEAIEEHMPLGLQLGAALDQQVGEVRDANENLAGINPQENQLLGRQKIFNETARLIDASHTLRDTLDDVELQLAGRSTPGEAAAGTELSSRLVSRAAPRNGSGRLLACRSRSLATLVAGFGRPGWLS